MLFIYLFYLYSSNPGSIEAVLRIDKKIRRHVLEHITSELCSIAKKRVAAEIEIFRGNNTSVRTNNSV